MTASPPVLWKIESVMVTVSVAPPWMTMPPEPPVSTVT